MKHSGSIQAFRGIAALGVLLSHLFLFQSGFNTMPRVTSIVTTTAEASVDMFFVLSGYLIFLLASKRAEHDDLPWRNALQFVLDRIGRIFPLFWITTLVVFLFRWDFEGLPRALWLLHGWHMLLLLGQDQINPAAWSLAFEVSFYVVTSALLLFGRNFQRAFWIVAALHIAFLYFVAPHIEAANPWLLTSVLTSPRSVEFVLGAVIARFPFNTSKSAYAGLLIAAVCLIGALVMQWHQWRTSMMEFTNWQHVFAFGLPSGLLLSSALHFERAGKFRPHHSLVVLGDMSYSLYLWHMPVLWILQVRLIAWGLFDVLPLPLTSALIGLPCLAVGWLSYRWIEKPTMSFVRQALALRSVGALGVKLATP